MSQLPNIFLVLVQAGFPTDPCWVEGEACVIGPDNLLSSLSEVPDVATCRQLCDNNQSSYRQRLLRRLSRRMDR